MGKNGARDTHLYEPEVGHSCLDLADDLGLGTGIERLELDVEYGFLLGLLLRTHIKPTGRTSVQGRFPGKITEEDSTYSSRLVIGRRGGLCGSSGGSGGGHSDLGDVQARLYVPTDQLVPLFAAHSHS